MLEAFLTADTLRLKHILEIAAILIVVDTTVNYWLSIKNPIVIIVFLLLAVLPPRAVKILVVGYLCLLSLALLSVWTQQKPNVLSNLWAGSGY